MSIGEYNTPAAEQYANPDQINTLYNLAVSLRGFSGIGSRFITRSPATPPAEVFAEAEAPTAADPEYVLSLSVMNDKEREEMVPHLIETAGPDQAAIARIYFDRTDRDRPSDDGSTARYVRGPEADKGPTSEAFVTYKILEHPSSDPDNPEPSRQLMKSTVESTDSSPEARLETTLAEAATTQDEDGFSVRGGTAHDQNEVFTVVLGAEAQSLIDYMTDEGVRQAQEQQIVIPPDFYSDTPAQ